MCIFLATVRNGYIKGKEKKSQERNAKIFSDVFMHKLDKFKLYFKKNQKGKHFQKSNSL